MSDSSAHSEKQYHIYMERECVCVCACVCTCTCDHVIGGMCVCIYTGVPTCGTPKFEIEVGDIPQLFSPYL